MGGDLNRVRDDRDSCKAAFVCPRGHLHYVGSAFCTVCGAGPVLPRREERFHWLRWRIRYAIWRLEGGGPL